MFECYYSFALRRYATSFYHQMSEAKINCDIREIECPEPAEGHWFLYILQCCDGSLYIGHSEDVAERVITHSKGHGAQWTASRTPLKLVYTEDHPDQLTAIRREKQIKGWSLAKKVALVRGDADTLRKLAKGKG